MCNSLLESVRPAAAIGGIAPTGPAGTAASTPVAVAIDLSTLFTEQRPRLLQLARSIVRCPHVAEDVVQDAMLAAVKSFGAFEGRAAAATWLHRIVVNAALMHLRRARSRPELGHDELDVTMVGRAEDPAAAAERTDTRDRLLACLEELSPVHRNVVELRDIQGLSTASVAAALAISENAAKIRLHRARRRLRDVFETSVVTGKRRVPARIVALPRLDTSDTRVAG